MIHTPIKAVLFDLDGTLLDTAGDLGFALNTVLQNYDREPLPLARIRPEAGRGGRGLIKLGFSMDETHADYPALLDQLLAVYAENIQRSTQLFPGMPEVLEFLAMHSLPWGIVTNKSVHLTQLLLARMPECGSAACIVSGDTLEKRKPHPEPLLHACELIQVDPHACLYIGDSVVDIIASKAAGIPALVAMYGYIPAREKPEEWGADGYVEHPSEIIGWVRKRIPA